MQTVSEKMLYYRRRHQKKKRVKRKKEKTGKVSSRHSKGNWGKEKRNLSPAAKKEDIFIRP